MSEGIEFEFDAFFPRPFSEISTPAEQTLALQRIMQLLPQVNRDTLFVLLHFLGLVADNSEDKAPLEESECLG